MRRDIERGCERERERNCLEDEQEEQFHFISSRMALFEMKKGSNQTRTTTELVPDSAG